MHVEQDAITEKKKGMLFTIQSRSGRELRDLSFYPDEEEVLFRPYTSFKVVDVEIKDIENFTNVYHITVTEAYPDIRGRKVLIWIYDRVQSQEEFHQIMDESEKEEVTCVHLRSTEATEFFKTHERLLHRNIDALRITTEARHEEDIEIGLKLIKLLKDSFNYNKPILFYTSSSSLLSNKKIFQANELVNVYASSTRQDAEGWARFHEIPLVMTTY